MHRFIYSVPCEYPGKNIAFHVNEGATNYWFAVLIEYEDGDGDLGAVDLKQVICYYNTDGRFNCTCVYRFCMFI